MLHYLSVTAKIAVLVLWSGLQSSCSSDPALPTLYLDTVMNNSQSRVHLLVHQTLVINQISEESEWFIELGRLDFEKAQLVYDKQRQHTVTFLFPGEYTIYVTNRKAQGNVFKTTITAYVSGSKVHE